MNAIPDFVRNWKPREMGEIVRRPDYPIPPRALEQAEVKGPREEQPENVMRVPCRCRRECPYGGRCGNPLISIPDREWGRASQEGLERMGELWIPYADEPAKAAE